MPAPRRRPPVNEAALREILAAQSGVVARRQIVRIGGASSDIRSRLLRREWVRLAPAVYLDHTGTPTWEQRCWAALLHLWPAALHRETALGWHGIRRDRSPRQPRVVHVLVQGPRQVRPMPGVSVERVKDATPWVLDGLAPPRTRVEYAALKVAADRDEAGAIALLSDVVQQGLTTATRLAATLDQLVRLPRRPLLREVLGDVEAGTRSVLEQRYLVRVERAHQLPVGQRQLRVVDRSGTAYRDVRYREQRVVVELDGAFGHRDSEDRWTDLDRDIAATVGGELTLRAGWAQVLAPCRLGGVVATVLGSRGWAGRPTHCGPACSLGTHGTRGS